MEFCAFHEPLGSVGDVNHSSFKPENSSLASTMGGLMIVSNELPTSSIRIDGTFALHCRVYF